MQGALPTIHQVVSSWEIDAGVIFSKHQRRWKICFKEIVTPHETWCFRSLTKNLFFFLLEFSFLPFCNFLLPLFIFFCFHVFGIKCKNLKTYSKGEGKNRKANLVDRKKVVEKKRKREVIRRKIPFLKGTCVFKEKRKKIYYKKNKLFPL